MKKMNPCHNNSKKSSTAKINKHTDSGYSLFLNCSFAATKNKLDYYRGKNCMENVCLGLKEHPTNIIDYEKERYDTINNGKKFAMYGKKNLVLMITNIKRLEIIVITLEKIEELLMIFAF